MRRLCLALLYCGFLLGLVSASSGKTGLLSPSTDAFQSADQITKLRVGIQLFDPGLPNDKPGVLERKAIYPEIRQAEAHHFAVHLKRTLDQTEEWEETSIVPGTAPVDLMLSGRILVSNGVRSGMQIRAIDASGKLWLKKKYRAKVDPEFYDLESSLEEDTETPAREPFQLLYDEIAADLLVEKLAQTEHALDALRWITRLKLAEQLAPEIFSGFLESDKKGYLHLTRLPSNDDPMLAFLERIEAAYAHFLKTVTLHQMDFSDRIFDSYEVWQQMSYESWRLMEENRESRIQVLDEPWDPGGDLIGRGAGRRSPPGQRTSVIMRSGVSPSVAQHSKIRREMGRQLSADVEPLLIHVEGQTLRLLGSLETQYETWRRHLRQIFRETTGLSNP